MRKIILAASVLIVFSCQPTDYDPAADIKTIKAGIVLDDCPSEEFSLILDSLNSELQTLGLEIHPRKIMSYPIDLRLNLSKNVEPIWRESTDTDIFIVLTSKYKRVSRSRLRVGECAYEGGGFWINITKGNEVEFMLHEIGHLFGLDHNPEPGFIMSNMTDGSFKWTAEEIETIKKNRFRTWLWSKE